MALVSPVVRNRSRVSEVSFVLMNPLFTKQRRWREQTGKHTVQGFEVDKTYLKKGKDTPFQTAIDYVRIGRDTQRALRPKGKKKKRRNSFTRFMNKRRREER